MTATAPLPRVVVVGDLVTDVVTRLTGPLARGSDTSAQVRLTGGGQAANTAAWLAHLGMPVTLVATVGDDPAGRERTAELAAAGVDCAVRAVAGVPTGTLVVLADRTERTFLTDRGAADQLDPADVDAALDRFPDTRHLHLSGYALLGEGSRAAGRHALAAARTRRLTTSVDAASTAPLHATADFLTWIRGSDLLLANAAEAAVLAAGPAENGDPAGPARALAAYASQVVIKLGDAGALWLGGMPDERLVREPAPTAGAVDPTGAGDAFAAGLLAAWLTGATPTAALRAAVRVGARAVTSVGGRPSSA